MSASGSSVLSVFSSGDSSKAGRRRRPRRRGGRCGGPCDMWSRRAACESMTTRRRFLPVSSACAAAAGRLTGCSGLPRVAAVAPLPDRRRPAATGFFFGSAPAAASAFSAVAWSTLEDAVLTSTPRRPSGRRSPGSSRAPVPSQSRERAASPSSPSLRLRVGSRVSSAPASTASVSCSASSTTSSSAASSSRRPPSASSSATSSATAR